MSFARSPMGNDAQDLAAWDGRDPAKVVLPLSVASGWAYARPEAFDEVMVRRGVRQDPTNPLEAASFLEVVNDSMFVCARAYVQPVGEGVVVAFRGTEPTDLINWLADATVERVAFHAKDGAATRGHVHGGFYRNIRAIWPLVVQELAARKPRWIYITGHSFGAALAALASALLVDYESTPPDKHPDYAELWGRVRGVFTFGQPIVGDTDFANSYREVLGTKLARFVFAQDIVPHLPSTTPGWTPEPFGKEYRGSEADSWRPSTELSDPVRFLVAGNLIAGLSWLKQQSGIAPDHPLPYSWADHAPNNYIRRSLPRGAESGSEFD
jgi:hypothetical protein